MMICAVCKAHLFDSLTFKDTVLGRDSNIVNVVECRLPSRGMLVASWRLGANSSAEDTSGLSIT